MSAEAFEGIVVGLVRVGDAHLIVRIMTDTHGVRTVMARGARSSKRRFGGCLEIGTELRIEVVKGKGNLPLLRTVNAIRSPMKAREELGRIAYLSYVCELVPALSSENTQTQKLYRLLQSFLSVLEQESAPVMATRIALEAKALTFAGLCPRLTGCACCGEPLENPVQFSATAGGVVHSRCGTGEPTTVKDVYSIEDLRRTPLAQTTTMSCPAKNQMTLSRFVEFQIARPLKSLAWVGEVELLEHRQEKT